MENFFDFFFHIDKNLVLLVNHFGILSYLLLFLVIFLETGLVVTPFLPGDSLLFAAGALSTKGALNVLILYLLLFLAAVVGDTVNYWLGHFIGPKAFDQQAFVVFLGRKIFLSKIFKKKYLVKAETFYEKHGGKAIILARFVPIVRTFAPFVAGIGKMNYTKFIFFNIIGGLLWVSLFLWGGYFFGAIPFVKKNFQYVVIVIIFLSLLPIFFEFVKAKKESV